MTSAAPTPRTLGLTIRRRRNVVEVSLAGALDAGTAPRLGEAMALAREMAAVPSPGEATGSRSGGRGHEAAIVIDTSGVDRLDADGYQALEAAMMSPDGLWDPGVACVLGPAVATFRASIRGGAIPHV